MLSPTPLSDQTRTFSPTFSPNYLIHPHPISPCLRYFGSTRPLTTLPRHPSAGCHAEGREFESLHPLKTPAKRGFLLSQLNRFLNFLPVLSQPRGTELQKRPLEACESLMNTRSEPPNLERGRLPSAHRAELVEAGYR
jgi:hypothetical protein